MMRSKRAGVILVAVCTAAQLAATGVASYLPWALYKAEAAETTAAVLNTPASASEEDLSAQWQNRTTYSAVFAAEPSTVSPYAEGSLNGSFVQNGLDMLNLIRTAAGLSSVTENSDLSAAAQKGALFALVSPDGGSTQPADMDTDFYTQASQVLANARTASGVSDLSDALIAMMSDSTSLDTMGDRLTILNPALSDVGFGYNGSSALLVTAQNGSADSSEAITWPAAGNMPTQLFTVDDPWTVTFNSSDFNLDSLSGVTVSIDHEGSTVTIDPTTAVTDSAEANTTASPCLMVLQGTSGLTDTLLFRPASGTFSSGFSGTYTVTISNLGRSDGTYGDVTYQVHFFDASEQPVQQMTTEEASIPVTGVTLDQTSLTFTDWNAQQLTATVSPDNADDKSVAWTSSDESVATVDANGLVTPVANGTAQITVTTNDGGFSASVPVTVDVFVPTPVTGVALDQAALTFTDWTAQQLTATVSPDNADDKSVTWTSSDESIATVDDTGLVTPVANGTAQITVTTEDGGYTATAAVQVKIPVSVTGVVLDKTELTFTEKTPQQLTAAVTPEDADNKTVFWKSSDENVVTVEPDGTVTPVSNGTAVITVSTMDGGYQAEARVTVRIPVPTTAEPTTAEKTTAEPTTEEKTTAESTTAEPTTARIAVQNIRIDRTSLFFSVLNTRQQLNVTVIPTNASDTKVRWSSSDISVATVDDNGWVTAVGNGKAVITATSEDGAKTAQSNVLVAVPVTELKVTPQKLTFQTADAQTLSVVISPENAANKNVTFVSSNPAVATVDEKGTVTPHANGTAIITVTSMSNGKYAQVQANVNIADQTQAQKNTQLLLDTYSLFMTTGTTHTLTATVSTNQPDTVTIQWNVNDPSIASLGTPTVTKTADPSDSNMTRITSTVTLSALKGGNAQVTASADSLQCKAVCSVTITQPAETTAASTTAAGSTAAATVSPSTTAAGSTAAVTTAPTTSAQNTNQILGIIDYSQLIGLACIVGGAILAVILVIVLIRRRK